MSDLIHIARDGTLLGKFSDEDIRALLIAGILWTTDDYWKKGMKDWQELEFLPRPPKDETSLLDLAKAGIAATGSRLGGTAIALGEQFRAFGKKSSEVAAGSKRTILEGYLPQIKRLLHQTISAPMLNAGREALTNDVLMTKIFGAVYDCLPQPVHRFVSDQEFIKFCLDHRQTLLE